MLAIIVEGALAYRDKWKSLIAAEFGKGVNRNFGGHAALLEILEIYDPFRPGRGMLMVIMQGTLAF